MIDWLPIAALKEIREMSYVMEKHSHQILTEKRAAMEQGLADPIRGDRKDLMTIMCKPFLAIERSLR